MLASFEPVLADAPELKSVPWQYAVVDEAHRLHDATTMLSSAVEAVEARARWAISATPFSVSSGDTGTHGLARALRMDPFRETACWMGLGRPSWVALS